MDRSEALLTPKEREALSAQRPPERFAERVMTGIAAVAERRRRRRRVLMVAAPIAGLAAAACAALLVRSPPSHGDVRADAREDVRLGPHVVAVLERGAHVSWDGDDVTQWVGDVFYRVEPGGTRRVHTPAGDVTVKGTCFDVKVRPSAQEGAGMTRRDAIAGATGAVLGAAVLVGVYEGKVVVSNARGAVDVGSGHSASADAHGVYGPWELASTTQAAETSNDEPWRTANAGLAEQLAASRRRLEENEARKTALEKDLRLLEARLAVVERDGAPAGPLDRDPRDLTPDDLKELAKQGRVRTRFFCPPGGGDWHASPEILDGLGLAPGDAPVIERAVQATQQRMWQAVEPECAKIVGSDEVAKRLGGEICGLVIQNAASQVDANRDIQLVADVLAGNKPMPPPAQIDPLTARLLALTSENAAFERDLAGDLGPEVAHRIARDEDQLGMGCALEFKQP
jgi:hypothetical protein